MRSVLAVGSHPDDIELGCGATLAAHVAAGDRVTFLVLSTGQRGPAGALTGRTMRRAEQEAACALLGADLLWGNLMDCAIIPNAQTVEVIEAALETADADVVYTHAPDDSHQDHRATSQATLSAARQVSSLLHYQSPSSLAFSPSVFVDVATHLDTKLSLLRCHASQVQGSLMVNLDAVQGAAMHWGSQSRLGRAEAFMPARMAWDLSPSPRQLERTERAEQAERVSEISATHDESYPVLSEHALIPQQTRG